MEESPTNDQSVDPYNQFTCAICNKRVSMSQISPTQHDCDGGPSQQPVYQGELL